jgi:hypothetical protein
VGAVGGLTVRSPAAHPLGTQALQDIDAGAGRRVDEPPLRLLRFHRWRREVAHGHAGECRDTVVAAA